MNKNNFKHNDCLNFSPIDVAKGICRLTNSIIFIDSQTCGKFNELPKCKNCTNFKNPNKDNIGTCTGLKKEAWAYGDLNAVTCEGYKKLGE
ncbi:4-hydroxyphenylacetate decarboxylase small subunit [Clostridium lundense]|uniref:4-hydroxyphenylacetate decarboxylase small subunit n=1 Tax=Clostridium lundense TaxID=319475 RepID=UPI000481F656|nr:4-hydroxyphenylacetate decarboxylase small subunit [Clostridium lundense]